LDFVMSEPTTTELLGGLLSDAKDLASAHAAQLKLEVRGELDSLKDTIKLVGVAIAAVVLAGGLIAHALALALTDASGLPPWASFGIVGIAAAIAGYVAYRRRPPAADLVPSDAISAVRRDVEHIAEAVRS
jgi:hypothetical protein